jgi:UDP-glucuronate decarboxylase
MRALVTGGAGFLGSHLCDLLLAKGYEVICVDNLITGNIRNIEHIKSNRFSYIKHDVTKPLYLEEKINFLFHLASPASPVDYLELPIQTLKVGALGTHNMLGLSKDQNARFFLASTSEVYGDPLVNPQSEDYWGNVNPIGPRGVYDEAKRFAEAITMAYHRYHKVDTRIVRIFNSILADEMIYLFNDNKLHIENVENYWSSIENKYPEKILVPAFDENGKVALRLADSFIKHQSLEKDAYHIRTRYGREIRVTGDHSVFVRGNDGKPIPKTVRKLEIGDYVAIPARLPAFEKNIVYIDIAQYIIRNGNDKEQWEFSLKHKRLSDVILKNKEHLTDFLTKSGRFSNSKRPRNTAGCSIRKFIKDSYAPLFVISKIYNEIPEEVFEDGEILSYGCATKSIKNRIKLTSEVLWLMGLYIAEGTSIWTEKQGAYYITLSSDEENIKKSIEILRCSLGCKASFMSASKGRDSQLYLHSKILVYLLTKILELPAKTKNAYIPRWIMQLPLSKLKFFLEGYKDGDGTHSGKMLKHELCFNTLSENLAKDLIYLLLRFGIVGCFGENKTTLRAKYGDRKFNFYRITVCNVDDFNILNWDTGVRQILNAKRYGDLIWAIVTSIEKIETTPYVYDFSVENYENFVAGTGVFAHNTYGPRMRLNDGRVVPNFIDQALRGDDLTVYGDGSQTRSFCYVSDEVEGIYRLMMSDYDLPVNIGNTEEHTILEFAKIIINITGSESKIVHKELPVDDPKQRRPDITKAIEILKWEPKISLEEGLRETIKHFKNL